jgi:hypothetical protein
MNIGQLNHSVNLITSAFAQNDSFKRRALYFDYASFAFLTKNWASCIFQFGGG